MLCPVAAAGALFIASWLLLQISETADPPLLLTTETAAAEETTADWLLEATVAASLHLVSADVAVMVTFDVTTVVVWWRCGGGWEAVVEESLGVVVGGGKV